jgi:hypothetical protein
VGRRLTALAAPGIHGLVRTIDVERSPLSFFAPHSYLVTPTAFSFHTRSQELEAARSKQEVPRATPEPASFPNHVATLRTGLGLSRVIILQGTHMDLQRNTYQQALVLRQTVSMSITTDTASEIASSSASTLAGPPDSMTAANRIGVAVRPTCSS